MSAVVDSKRSSQSDLAKERDLARDPLDPAQDITDKERASFSSNTPTLADRKTAYHIKNGPITDAVLNFFSFTRKHRDTSALDDIATQPSVYDGPHASHYQPRADWENIEAFDPSFRWTWREEQKVIRKVDWRILTWVCVMFFAVDVDRYNVTAATSDNLLGDLGLTQADYNLGNTLSKLGFLLAELPSQLISKRLGPDRWIPLQIIIFSILSGAQFFLSGRASFLALRFLIAAFQGGFIPDIILYLSYWYNRYDLPLRLAIFYTVNFSSAACTAFLGAGLNQMRGVLGHAGWRWMFLLEGLFTLLIGVASFFLMPTSPAKTKTSFRPNGLLSEHEAKIIVNRVIRDEPTKGDMHNRQALTLHMIWKSLMDWHLYPIYLIEIAIWIPVTPVTQYLQLSFRQNGFSVIMSNLLAVPNAVIAIVNCVFIAMISELFDNRTFVGMAQVIWVTPCLIALVAMPTISPWQYFALLTVLLGYPYVHTVMVSWCSRNSGSIRTRTVSASWNNMCVQAAQIIGSNIYQASDAPRYRKGNSILLGISGVAFALFPSTYFFYKYINQRRDRIWDAMSDDEKSHYLATTKDEGAKRLDFRFAT